MSRVTAVLCLAALFCCCSATHKKRITDLEKLVAQQAEKISDLTEKLTEIKTAVQGLLENSVKTEVSVVSGEEDLGDSSCVKVCAGSTGRNSTQWTDYWRDGVYTIVDISQCGFVKVPTITTDIEGYNNGYQWKTTSAIYTATTTSFKIQVRNESYNPQGGKAAENGWNVEWIAVGFTC